VRKYVDLAVILALGLAAAIFVDRLNAYQYETALNNYRIVSLDFAKQAAGRVTSSLNQIYQNIRTISFLPSVRDIDRHARNFDDNARISIQQIYNNLASSVSVSEVYIVPADLNPEAIDPVTGKPEEPILMFDELITDRSGGFRGSDYADEKEEGRREEVEIFEYRLLREQMARLKKNYPTAQSVKGLNVPMISGREVITCDNTEYNKSLLDADRMGLIFSVPFYGNDGRLKGTISAIIRTKALQRLLPEQDFALVNVRRGFVAPSLGQGQQAASSNWVRWGLADPSLLFSAVVPIDINDRGSRWLVWAGTPNEAFLNSAEARRIWFYHYAGLGLCAVVTLLAMLLWTMFRKKREAQLTQWRDLSNAALEGLIICDGNTLVTTNGSFDRLVGASQENCGREIFNFFEVEEARQNLHNGIEAPFETELTCASGEKVPIEARVRDITYMGRPHRVVAVHDLRERRKAEESIRFLAHHDPLTKLANRNRFQEEMDRALKRAERGERFAVLCLDLDHFKQVNDTLGHAIGDQLLISAAQRIEACVRKTDTVARIGGDEFAIVQSGGELPIGSTSLAARLIESISKPYLIDGHQLAIGTSVGIAIAPEDGNDPETLLKNADLALYRAKTDGRGVFRLFEPEMDARMQARRKLELDLRNAVQLEEFEPYYQPLVDVGTQELTGFEALLRWRHPTRGLVPPLDFIPVAEEIGLMGQIGAWILKRACSDAVRWPAHVRIAVNISAVQFKGRPLELDVITALGTSGLAASRLELEITESVLLENSEATIATLRKLRALGVRIAMDDFGTGYSSLSYLSSFPFDKIKLDRSFTKGAGVDANSQAIIRAVIGLGTSLGISTTAEGVETHAQLALLKSEGCHEVQGYLYSKPLPVEEIPGLIEKLNPRRQAAAG
jgi:diguanylate cyclase (GGDEF)-like protein/PAS domain S-box-containing protein